MVNIGQPSLDVKQQRHIHAVGFHFVGSELKSGGSTGPPHSLQVAQSEQFHCSLPWPVDV
ncbi:MAG: hypothetical protein KDA58_02040 [Planctomycetaceae bacterium]|nr:hypothetical protein [Planctomycetaceae bacterium]